MVQIIEEPPSFGAIMGRGLGQLGGAYLGKKLQDMQESKKAKAFQEQFGFDPRTLGPEGIQAFAKKLGEARGGMEILKALKGAGGQTDSGQTGGIDAQSSTGQMSPEQREMVPFVSPQYERYLESQEKMLQRERLAEGKQSFAREQAGEPKLQELSDKLESYEQSGLRFDRLNNLFSPELENKFPPALLAGALTKNGELRPTAQATLSPEAQEAVKLVTDEIRGAKDTFGARVTNFDATTYLKTLPGLLNTAEGRRRVLRDLRIMNKLNQMHSEGVLDIVDRFGGPGKISLSKAQRIYKKENVNKINDLKKAFVNPEKAEINELDDFTASINPGMIIEDPETGQRFKSNGQTWEMQ